MDSNKARVRKLVSGFNALTEEDKTLVFKKMGVLKQEENSVFENQNNNLSTTTASKKGETK